MNLTSEYFQSLDLTIWQPRRGHRYGEESIGLTNFCRASSADRVIELGSGVGVIAAMIAKRCSPARCVAVEIQKGLHDIAVKNVVENRLDGIVELVNADYRVYSRDNAGRFDVAVANPPFYKVGDGRMSEDPQRAVARHEVTGTLPELFEASRSLLISRGRLFIVLSVGREADLHEAAEMAGFSMNCRKKTDSVIYAEFHKVGI